MYYDKRNRAALAELAPNTKKAALKWYDFLIKNDIELLIYDARRTYAEQLANVRSGASQTMTSYHLVGQALDFVPITNGKADWAGYGRADIKKALAEAKRLGFEWGGDWASFVDKPHLQYNYKGYGSDKVLAASAATPAPKPASKPAAPQGDGKAIVPVPKYPLYRTQEAKKMFQKDIERVQRAVGVPVTSKFDAATEKAVKAYQKRKKLDADGVVGKDTWNMLF
ncbi:M15 family metallopeptidase [Exiguobacterium sp. s130]|uniref:M15 family metallopeptidase n=1 Tax=Exiguobacterium sp. s130 TaxID=2751190 RepID=UPI001BEA81DD|nr:M15 family metallopeptidase [Exiguobacterium sp. s130]